MKNLKNINLDSVRSVVMANKDKAKKFVVDNLPNIFSCGAVASLGGAVYLTATGMHRADDILNAEQKRLEETLPDYDGSELTFARKAELVWKEFVPAAIATAASGLFIIASNRAGHEKYMAMLGAYELSKKAFDDYRDSAIDILGEEKSEEIENRVAVQQAARNTPAIAVKNVDGSSNPTLFVRSGLAFYADIDTVYHAVNWVNHELNSYRRVSENEFLEAIGVSTRHNDDGDKKLWEPTTAGDMVEIRFGHDFYDDSASLPCAVIRFNREPQYEVQFEDRYMRWSQRDGDDMDV